MIALLASFWPVIAGVLGLAGGVLFGWMKTKQAQTTTAQADAVKADAGKQVAEAQTQIANVQNAEAQANASAAQAGADSFKEKVNVTNDVSALPTGAAASELRNDWTKD